ncbi:Autophagy-related protein 29 [Penicillium ucsense]|uniref:Autophagy-related protein 29 n=1 Tax=Penicillium ucsense TaxID=2839758 RepID=A0A8J8W655_9EURO|nr:Autophagy-related protein 29 [Penicillium ucsense]
MESSDTNFTVFIRLPFPRGEFLDPPPVEWDATKDQALWDVLSRPSKGKDIDWKALAEHFDVTLHFLLQQAAWLYDRQLSQVRAQMRKVPPVQPSTPSPVPDSVSGSAALTVQAQRQLPGLGGPRGPQQQIFQQRDSPHEASGDRRASSTSTATLNQFRHSRDSSRHDPVQGTERRWENFVRRPSGARREPPTSSSHMRSPPLAEQDPSSSSTDPDSESDVESSRGLPRFKKFGKFSMQRAGLSDAEDEDEDDVPAFLPMARDKTSSMRGRLDEKLSTTIRDNEKPLPYRPSKGERTDRKPKPSTESFNSSISSGTPASLSSSDRHGLGQLPSALSPHRVGEPPRQSPRKSTASGREASDGTPSMGSSFSDLDDASVTQSALEEALMSNMQHGGMASRMSTISQALRSRYLQ